MKLANSVWQPLVPGRLILAGPSRRSLHWRTPTLAQNPAPSSPPSLLSAHTRRDSPHAAPLSSSSAHSRPAQSTASPRASPSDRALASKVESSSKTNSSSPGQSHTPAYLRHPVGVPLSPQETAEKPTKPRKGQRTIQAPPLPRPLGSRYAPRASEKTWDGELQGEARVQADRGNIIRETGRGYYYDLHKARKADGGKLWTAPEVLIREDMARYFPNIAGTNLLNAPSNTTQLLKGGVSIVAILNTRLSEEQTEHWTKSTLEDQAGKSGFRYVQINYQENPLKSIISNFFTSAVKRTVPEDRWGTYIMAKTGWSEIDVIGPLGIDNKLIGYIYLVDADCRIRWAACGPPQNFEIESLRLATSVLMRRMGGKDEAKAGTTAPASTAAAKASV